MAKQVKCRHHVELVEWKIKPHSHSSCFLVIYFNLFNKGRVICNICVYNHRSSNYPLEVFIVLKLKKQKKPNWQIWWIYEYAARKQTFENSPRATPLLPTCIRADSEISELNTMLLFYWLKNSVSICPKPNIWWCYHWFPRQMTSEKQVQKFHTDDTSLPKSG